MTRLIPLVRVASALSGLMFLVITLGFFFQASWATRLWPWPDSRLSYIFIASITAAVMAPLLWLAAVPDWRASAGGGLNLAIAFAGMSANLALLLLSGQRQLLLYLAGFVLITLAYLAGSLWALLLPLRDTRPMPRLVRFSFALFAVVLVLTALALIFKAPTVFPWPLKPETSVMFGWVFMGAAVYFAYGAFQRHWHDARGQLLGFLAYDLVLIGPFLADFASVPPGHLLSLTIYVVVLVYSGALAIFYLFVNPRTRSWPIQSGQPARSVSPAKQGLVAGNR
jgi:hypothetical protein